MVFALATSLNHYKGAFRMSNEFEWTLQRIREAYGDILRAWNDLFPLYPQKGSDQQEPMESIDFGDIEFLEKCRRKGKEIGIKLKKAADQSGNAVVWRRGDPVDGLPNGIRERVERALKLGI
jgi:hypothetical protein